MEASIGVVFDCDGTLLDTMGAWHGLEGELADMMGVVLTKEDTDTIATLTIDECGAYYHEHFGFGESGPDVVRLIDRHMYEYYAAKSQAKPGALALVKGLYALGVRMTVASSTPHGHLEAGLAHCGIAPYLDAILSVDDVGASKRDPLIFERARAIMGTPLSATWGVEDSIYAMNTLAKAGFRTLAIYDNDLSGTYGQLAAVAEHIISSFEELDAATLVAWT